MRDTLGIRQQFIVMIRYVSRPIRFYYLRG